MYETLEKLEKLDLISECVEKGIISPSIIRHKELFERIKNEKGKGKKISEIMTQLSFDERISESNLYKIHRKMKSN